MTSCCLGQKNVAQGIATTGTHNLTNDIIISQFIYILWYTYSFVFVVTKLCLTKFKEVRLERLALTISKTKIPTQSRWTLGLKKKKQTDMYILQIHTVKVNKGQFLLFVRTSF